MATKPVHDMKVSVTIDELLTWIKDNNLKDSFKGKVTSPAQIMGSFCLSYIQAKNPAAFSSLEAHTADPAERLRSANKSLKDGLPSGVSFNLFTLARDFATKLAALPAVAVAPPFAIPLLIAPVAKIVSSIEYITNYYKENFAHNPSRKFEKGFAAQSDKMLGHDVNRNRLENRSYEEMFRHSTVDRATTSLTYDGNNVVGTQQRQVDGSTRYFDKSGVVNGITRPDGLSVGFKDGTGTMQFNDMTLSFGYNAAGIITGVGSIVVGNTSYLSQQRKDGTQYVLKIGPDGQGNQVQEELPAFPPELNGTFTSIQSLLQPILTLTDKSLNMVNGNPYYAKKINAAKNAEIKSQKDAIRNYSYYPSFAYAYGTSEFKTRISNFLGFKVDKVNLGTYVNANPTTKRAIELGVRSRLSQQGMANPGKNYVKQLVAADWQDYQIRRRVQGYFNGRKGKKQLNNLDKAISNSKIFLDRAGKGLLKMQGQHFREQKIREGMTKKKIAVNDRKAYNNLLNGIRATEKMLNNKKVQKSTEVTRQLQDQLKVLRAEIAKTHTHSAMNAEGRTDKKSFKSKRTIGAVDAAKEIGGTEMSTLEAAKSAIDSRSSNPVTDLINTRNLEQSQVSSLLRTRAPVSAPAPIKTQSNT